MRSRTVFAALALSLLIVGGALFLLSPTSPGPVPGNTSTSTRTEPPESVPGDTPTGEEHAKVTAENTDRPAPEAGSGTLSGIVRNERGQPLSGITLHALTPGSDLSPLEEFFNISLPLDIPAPGEANHSAESDAEGRFSIGGLAPGEYTLVARGRGYRRGQVAGIRVEADGVTETEVSLKAGLVIEGIVLDPLGAPRAGAEVRATGGVMEFAGGMLRLGGPGGELQFDTIQATTNRTGVGVSAVPAAYGATGRFTFILSQDGKIYKKDTFGKPIDRWPGKNPATQGWTVAQ